MRNSAAVIILGVATACATAPHASSERLSIEFGQDAFLTPSYLLSTPDARCGPPAFAPGGMEAAGPLPDQTWFRVVAIPSADPDPQTVIFERGHAGQGAQLTMRYERSEGIVRLTEGAHRDAWGANHPWAEWMRALGSRVLTMECA